jgi:hypothetical protein
MGIEVGVGVGDLGFEVGVGVGGIWVGVEVGVGVGVGVGGIAGKVRLKITSIGKTSSVNTPVSCACTPSAWKVTVPPKYVRSVGPTAKLR